MRFKIAVAFLMWAMVAAPRLTVEAQMPASVQREEMKKLDFLVGEWKGGGWIEGSGRRSTFTTTEIIQSKLGGLGLLIEGIHKYKVPGKEGEVTGGFEALAIVTYDEQAKLYRWRSATTHGRGGNFEAKLIGPGTLQWGDSSFRYTIKITEAGQWHEIGEFPRDGKAWERFFEMTLQRVK